MTWEEKRLKFNDKKNTSFLNAHNFHRMFTGATGEKGNQPKDVFALLAG